MRSSMKNSVLLSLAALLIIGVAQPVYADDWIESGSEPRTVEGYRFAMEQNFKFTYPSITVYGDRNDTDPYTRIPIFVKDNANVEFHATEGDITVGDATGENYCYWGGYVDDYDGDDKKSSLLLDAKKNITVMGDGYHHFGISAYSNSTTTLKAGGTVTINGGYSAVYARDEVLTGNTVLTITSEEGNVIHATETPNVEYGSNCVSANDGAEIRIEAKNGDNQFIGEGPNHLLSAIDANVITHDVSNMKKQNLVKVTAVKGSNIVSHQNEGMDALKNSRIELTAYKDNTITTTLPNNTIGIESGGKNAEVQLTAQHGNNTVTADYALYVYQRGKVTLDAPEGTNTVAGTTLGVAASSGGAVAIHHQSDIKGGTVLQAEGKDTDEQGNPTGDAASIEISYEKDSKITGTIQAYNEGKINIAPSAAAQGKETIVGNVVAYGQNEVKDPTTGQVVDDPSTYVGGTVEMKLTNGSSFTGKADVAYDIPQDYGTVRMGTFNLDLPAGSVWNMTDTSSVTNLTGNGGTVHFNDGGKALQITFGISGSHTFDMDLSMDGSQSDMIYMRQGTSDEQTLNVKNIADLNSSMQPGDAVRFAVVSESYDEFRNGKVYAPAGVTNEALTVEYRDVATDPLNTDAYNNAYNGDSGANKPTTAQVKAFYIDGFNDPQYVYLVKSVKEEEEKPNDGAKLPGKAGDLMWRYVTDLDTFTKRSGQSVYFTPGADQGGWLRLGYRNFGVDGVGELDGNSYELGYTDITKQDAENKHRISASVGYATPSGRWEGSDGDLDVKDFYVSLFDTHQYYPSAEKLAGKPEWKKESHAYWDNYFKYHHVRVEDSTRDHQTGLDYSGDYSQDVYNLSTEYGHQLMLNEDWYWVPQAQLQLSYVGGYDYHDSQHLHVNADHDWSLIGRLGFDLVKKLDPKQDSKLYFKAGLLHEFMDGADITTSALGRTYRHEGDSDGTWGVVGLGYSAHIGENQYMYLDLERYFGNDFERTYNLRAGVNWKF